MMHVIILNLRKTAWVMKFGLNESELFVVPSALAWLEFRVQLYFFLGVLLGDSDGPETAGTSLYLALCGACAGFSSPVCPSRESSASG